MTAKDEADVILQHERDRRNAKILIAVGIVVIIAFLAVIRLSETAKLEENDSPFGSDGATKSHDEGTYQSRFAINETYLKAIEEERARNLTIHISPNAAQNVSIWKGDKLVAYIPR